MALRTERFVIPDEGTTSNAITRGAEDLVGVIMPADASITGTKISFYGSHDGTTYYPIEYEGTAVEVSVSTAATINLIAVEKLAGVPYLKVVSDATESAGPITIIPLWRRYF